MVLILNNFRRGCVGINGLCFILKMKTNYTACSVDTQKVVPCGLMNGNEHDGLHTDIKQQCFLDFLFLIFYFSLFSTRSSSLVLFCAQTTVQNRLCPVGLSSIMFFSLFLLFNSESFFSKVFWMIVFFSDLRSLFIPASHACLPRCTFSLFLIFLIVYIPHKCHSSFMCLK